MVVVNRIVPGQRDVRVHPTETWCEFQVLMDADGNKYFQLTTFGSSDRKGSGVTQTLQFDRKSAKELSRLLTETFWD